MLSVTSSLRVLAPLALAASLSLALTSGCIDAPIESSAPDGGENGNGNNDNGAVDCPDPAALDAAEFESALTQLDQNCGLEGCHAPGSNIYEVDADDPEASLASFIEFSDCGDTDESDILRYIDGRETHTGGEFEDAVPPAQDYLEIIAQAAGENGNGDAGACGDPEDVGVQEFESAILTDLDQNCGLTGCHEPGTEDSVYIADGSDPEGSLASFLDFSDCQNPEDSEILRFVDGRETHTGGQLDDAAQYIGDYLDGIAEGE